MMKECKDKEGEAQALGVVADCHLRLQDIRPAARAAKKQLDLYKRLGVRSKQMEAFDQLGQIFLCGGKNQDAISNIIAAKDLAGNLHRRRDEVIYATKLVRAYIQAMDEATSTEEKENILDVGQKAAEEAHLLSENFIDEKLKASATFWFAHILVSGRMYSAGLEKALIATAMASGVGDAQQKGHALLLKAVASLGCNEGSQGVAAAREALSIFKDVEDKHGEETALVLIEKNSTEESTGPDINQITSRVMSIAQDTAGFSELALDASLMEAGLDSLSSLEFRNRIVKDFGVDVPAALVFDYPSVNQVANLVLFNVQQSATAKKAIKN